MRAPRADEPALTRAVADAAEAWLRAPGDVGRYARLVNAVDHLRAWRAGLLVKSVDGLDLATSQSQAEELLDELADGEPAVGLGELLDGDPHTVLARLRGDSPPVDRDASGTA